MKRYFLCLGVFSAIFCMTSCSQGYIQAVAANQQAESGRFQDALARYLKAVAGSRYRDYFAYNIGNVYYLLGEPATAGRWWDKASESSSAEVRFGAAFNRGVAYYEEGEYPRAYSSFRKAVELVPASREAKINMEYAYRKIEQVNTTVTAAAEARLEEGGEIEEPLPADALMELITEEAQNRWFRDLTREGSGPSEEDW